MEIRQAAATKGRSRRTFGIILGFAALAFLAAPIRGLCAEDAAAKGLAASVRELTGAHTRIVWLRDSGENPAPWGGGPGTRLMGFDTDDGKGIRPILPDVGGYSWAYFTPDGKGVAFTRNSKVMYVNWDGTGLRGVVQEGWLAAVSGDPKGKYVWLYVQHQVNGKFTITRHRLDKPSVKQVGWNKNKTIGCFTVSTDGKLGSGVYDNPGAGPCGIFEMPNVAWHSVANGCQPCMLPGTNPYRLWVFHGDHRSGTIFTNPTDPENRTQQRVSLAQAPGTLGRHEVSYAKWSNNVRFMLLSAPFTSRKNEEGIPFPGGESLEGKYKRYYDKVEISIGKLDEGLTKIERWVQITDDDKGDYVPEAWIEPDPDNAPPPQAK